MTPTRAIRHLGILAAAALLVTAVSFKPVTVYAMGTDTPYPTTDDSGKKKKKKNDGSAIEQQQQQEADAKFLRDYRAARELILAGNYDAGIAAMHALGRDEHPDVANYIGYSYRRMGNYEQSKVWYERALASDPDHVRTWSYYGMWQMEQGNRLKAEDDLKKVRLLCGNTSCQEYIQLRAVIDGTGSY
ncbi:MAG TPA: tetratricopeptide repeat protein [Pseudolabrys sp.]|nr:tetratricopeptide repeat protein [Pseudolabrys sp.]